ncbi:MAG: ArnT family glycosyltransferase, partial [Anaerolineae bacterium]
WSYLYTLYLAAVYGLAGYHPLVARLIQAVLAGLLMPWLVYRLGRRYFGRRAGLVAAGFVAVYAYFVYYAAALMTETFYITGILWTLDLAGGLGQDRRIQPSVFSLQPFLFGLALAVTVLLRQVFLLFIPVLFAWLLWRAYHAQTRPVLRMIGTLLIATAILTLAIAPWTARNYRVFGRFVLLNTNAGFAFFWANHPIHGYNFTPILPAGGPSYQDLIPPELLPLDEAALDQALLQRGLEFIRQDPGRYLMLSLSRAKDYFKFWPSPESSLVSNVARVFSFGLLWPLMAYGFIASLRRLYSSGAFILHLFVLVYTAIHLLSWALIRYRLPVDAVLIVFASAALVDLWAGLARRRTKIPNIQYPISKI